MKLSNRWGSITLAAALSLSLFAVRAPADDLPTFSDPEVNTFVSDYAAFVTNYIQAYQAAQAGNLSQFAQVKTQVKQLQDQVTKVADKLLSKPDEAQRYEQFITEYTEKMVDATK